MEKILLKMNEYKKSYNGFIRKYYIEKIEKYMWFNLVKVLIWQRRVWKSYIMKTIINKIWTHSMDNIFYVNYEIDDFQELKVINNLKVFFEEYFIKNIDKSKKIYVFFGEIQELNSWETFINSLLAKYQDNIEIFISWSNANLLSWELSTYLSWRYIEFLILPFLFDEYSEYTANNSIIKYLNSTGLPEAIKISSLNDKEMMVNYFNSVKNTIILKDIVTRYKIKEIFLLETLFLFLVDNIWWLFSGNSIVKKLKSSWINTNHNTLWTYLYYLENTFLIYWVYRFDLKWKKIFELEKKYYINDLWYRNYLTSSYDLWLSKHLENYVFLFLKKHWFQVYVWKIWDFEIDFIAQRNWKNLFIQVCMDLSTDGVLERETRPFFLIDEKSGFYLITIWKQFQWNYKWIDIIDIEQIDTILW